MWTSCKWFRIGFLRRAFVQSVLNLYGLHNNRRITIAATVAPPPRTTTTTTTTTTSISRARSEPGGTR